MRIAVVSDTHLTPRTAACAENWAAVVGWIAATEPDLVVHLGDITADGVTDPDELRAAWAIVGALPVPVRFLPGNHDIGDNPLEARPPVAHAAPGAERRPHAAAHPLDHARLADYRRIFGLDRWSIGVGPWQLVGLNAQLLGTGSEEEEAQFAWLDERLQRAAGPLGVLLHKPLFRSGPDDTEVHVRYVPARPRRRLLTALATRDLRFVLAGHTHQSRRLCVDGVDHIWAPSTAFYLADTMQERIGDKMVGVLTLELSEAGHRLEAVTPPGVVRHNILDFPDAYPGLVELKARLAATAAL